MESAYRTGSCRAIVTARSSLRIYFRILCKQLLQHRHVVIPCSRCQVTRRDAGYDCGYRCGFCGRGCSWRGRCRNSGGEYLCKFCPRLRPDSSDLGKPVFCLELSDRACRCRSEVATDSPLRINIFILRKKCLQDSYFGIARPLNQILSQSGWRCRASCPRCPSLRQPLLNQCLGLGNLLFQLGYFIDCGGCRRRSKTASSAPSAATASASGRSTAASAAAACSFRCHGSVARVGGKDQFRRAVIQTLSRNIAVVA